MSTRIKDTDRGYKKFVKGLRAAGQGRGPKVSVGIHSAEGSIDREGVTILEVAIFNEFGTRTTPERSFLRAWFDENRDRALETWKILMKKAAKGSITKIEAAEQFGLWCVGEIQARIASSIPPPNAPSTVARKGSTTTLINTGQLRSSITHQVTARVN